MEKPRQTLDHAASNQLGAVFQGSCLKRGGAIPSPKIMPFILVCYGYVVPVSELNIRSTSSFLTLTRSKWS